MRTPSKTSRSSTGEGYFVSQSNERKGISDRERAPAWTRETHITDCKELMSGTPATHITTPSEADQNESCPLNFQNHRPHHRGHGQVSGSDSLLHHILNSISLGYVGGNVLSALLNLPNVLSRYEFRAIVRDSIKAKKLTHEFSVKAVACRQVAIRGSGFNGGGRCDSDGERYSLMTYLIKTSVGVYRLIAMMLVWLKELLEG
ncbi:hypothetical protein PM082_009381 [Marasmius tenuissimus]|nr:hypothetical protein PM082_009381 [Marasmius tenuissimus]